MPRNCVKGANCRGFCVERCGAKLFEVERNSDNYVTVAGCAAKAQDHANGDGALRKPKTARIEALWLEATVRLFWTVDDLVRHTGKSKRRIQWGLQRARQDPLELATVWDIEWRSSPNAFVEEHQCQWHGGPGGEIPQDFPAGCLFCLKAGLEAMIKRHGKPIGASDQPDEDLSGGEIAASVQSNGPAKFKPHTKGAKREPA